MKYRYLTESLANEFVERGYIVIKNAFPRALADEWIRDGWRRLGYDPNDKSTWAKPRIHLPHSLHSANCAEMAPKVWDAICDLLGGEERIRPPFKLADSFIFNLGVGADRPWDPPSPEVMGWHKDGDFFRHFLDSPEQGLLTIVCWTDMVHQGGGTFIAPDSVGVVARHLAEHPEGMLPQEMPAMEWIKECKEFVELTGVAGDVVLHHPYMLHATSQNVLRHGRAITNPPVFLKEPMNFNRADPAEFSPVERAVLHGLGVERLDFRPTRPREKIIPPRVQYQQKILDEEKARLAAARQ